MARRMRRASGDDAGEVNVTPLLDIVFIMLIFFIVTATFVYEDGITPNLPQNTEQDQPTNPPPSLLLSVQNDGFVVVDGTRTIDPRSVGSVVEEFFAKEARNKGVVIVSAAPDASTGDTMVVLDEARDAAGEPELLERITLTLAGEQ